MKRSNRRKSEKLDRWDIIGLLIAFAVGIWMINGGIIPGLKGILLDGVLLGGLDGESIFPTLMNLLISIYTLAVTIFIFLATALTDRREDYEQSTIHKMLGKRTNMLFVLSIISVVCIVCCLWIDRLEQIWGSVKSFVSWVSIVDICLLLNYSITIIGYDSEIRRTAKKHRKQLETDIKSKNPNLGSEEPEVTMQMIGNLAMVVDRLIANHVKEYHYNDREQVLHHVLSFKPKDTNKTSQDPIDKSIARIAKMVLEDVRRADDQIVADYQQLISYRDYLRVEYTDSEEMAQCDSHFLGTIDRLRGRLKTELMMGESLTDMTFLGDSFFEHRWPFNLSGAILCDSLFSEINMNGANLTGADMSRTRLVGVSLKNADCSKAVFAEAIWKDVIISAGSNFDKAVFRNVDFNGQNFYGGKVDDEFQLLPLTNTSFVHANMLDCGMHCVDLRYSSMKDALLPGARFNTAALSFADLSGAILTKVLFQHDGIYPEAFPPEEFALMESKNCEDNKVLAGFELEIQVKGKKKPLCPAFHANLEKATLAQSIISQYNWNGSRIADCNFTHAKINDCVFDSCFGRNVTFRDAKVRNTRFNHAMLNTADFSYALTSGCDFTDANLQNCLFIHKDDSEKNGHIHGCTFLRTNFARSQFQGCVFKKCNFENANFSRATQMNVEFHDCTGMETANYEDCDRNDVKIFITVTKRSDIRSKFALRSLLLLKGFKNVQLRFSKDDDARCDYESQKHSSV